MSNQLSQYFVQTIQKRRMFLTFLKILAATQNVAYYRFLYIVPESEQKPLAKSYPALFFQSKIRCNNFCLYKMADVRNINLKLNEINFYVPFLTD